MKWQSITAAETIRQLETDSAKGLLEEIASQRLVKYGTNELLRKKKTSLLNKFFQQFNDFMILVLITAAAVSFMVSVINGESDFADPIIILSIVVLNAILGLIQESRAEKSLEALQKMSAPMARVLRGGLLKSIAAEYLTVGDIILLETGDNVPADARLISSVNLRVEESALTGESSEAKKSAAEIVSNNALVGDRINMVFFGSSVTCGRGKAVVTAVGMNTEVGRIAGLLLEHKAPETPLQKKLESTGKALGLAALAICAAIFVMGILRHIPPFSMFMMSVSLAVAAIPEGLPAIVTIMLGLGVQRMAKENAIIRKLPAVETLGGATVVCSDKTGTLTQNQMRLTEIKAHTNDRLVLEYATLCSNVTETENGALNGTPTETAIADGARRAGINLGDLAHKWQRVAEMPFDSNRKRMSTRHINEYETLTITKGAPDVLLERCALYLENGKAQVLTHKKRREILQTNAIMAEKALRVLAVAFDASQPSGGEIIENGLTFMGLLGFIDPPRPEAAEAVAICRQAGIKPVMITGDHVATACAIAKETGILLNKEKCLTGHEIDGMNDDTLSRHINEYSVFARVTPEHKVRIVKAFQKQGAVVAMTGDGVNDAPALKAADIGCAMGLAGTDVAKEAADMVLTDDNFATIVKAVREGRNIYDNIRKAVHFLLSSNIGEILTIFTAIFMGWHTPLAAIHLLWVNLVTDSLPAIALGFDPPDKDIMKHKPRNAKTGLFADGLTARIAAEGVLIGFLALTAFGIGAVYFGESGNHTTASTMCFATLSLSQLVHAFNMRSETSIFKIDLLSNLSLIGALVVGTLMQVFVVSVPYLSAIFKVTPLNQTQWLIVAGLSFMPVVVVELQKSFNALAE